MVRLVEEGPAVIAVQKETGAVFQVGSQYASSVDLREGPGADQAGRHRRGQLDRGAVQPQLVDRRLAVHDPDRRLARDGRLGPVPRLGPQASVRRRSGSSAGGTTPTTARPWRATCSSTCSPASTTPSGSLGPNRIAGMGGQRYWKDGRDVYDLIMGLMDYPETDSAPGLHAVAPVQLRGRRRRRHAVPVRRQRRRDQRQLHPAHPQPDRASSSPRPRSVLKGYNSVTHVLAGPAEGARREAAASRPPRREGRGEPDLAREVHRAPAATTSGSTTSSTSSPRVREKKPVVRGRRLRLPRRRPGTAVQREPALRQDPGLGSRRR